MTRSSIDKIVVAIDGPSGVGKTTISKRVADRFSLKYVDTGAMYRALAVGAEEAGVDIDNDESLSEYLSSIEITFKDGRIYLNGKDLTERIREPDAGVLASKASSKTLVRDFLVAEQRRLGLGGGVVMEGRDIGTVVFPDADLKIFLTAREDVRALRRHGDYMEKGITGKGVGEVKEELNARDKRDTTRANSPLVKASDAVTVDTSEMTIEGVVEKINDLVTKKVG